MTGDDSREDKTTDIQRMLSKQTNARLKSCAGNIAKHQSKIKEAQERINSGASWDVIGINLTLQSAKEKADAEANKYYEALDTFLEGVVDKTTPEKLVAIENGISKLKMGINVRILDMEKSSLDLRRIMSKH